MKTVLWLAAVGLSSPLSVDALGGDSAEVLFSEPVVVIAGPPSAIRLSVSPDSNHQLFGEPRSKERGGLQVLERHRAESGWGAAEEVPFNTEWSDFDPAFSLDGSGVYFFSDRPGGEGGDDIWFVPLKEGVWGEPVNLGKPVNSPGDEWAPTPLAGNRLLFSSDGHGGFGAQDLYVSKRASDGWDVPRNLGAPVNSPAYDYDAAFLTDNLLMLTRSDDPGSGSEIFFSCRSEGRFAEPQFAGPAVNLGGGWALGPSVSTAEPGVVYFSSREPGASNTRIYRASYTAACSGSRHGR